ncbi:uncharacterized protein BXZ73DRAFT_76076 [Epithele typhae]|uniref:uncharacterized protein n=1 Tax=Epithele typhae TaxID=378194 RepID=UPI002007BA2A|nr:uncharacterized protein BXZ73DRAFT_76076 [Epithele typhae]KAH9939372.1 hypothetical protein BXZ73DRAFT_76076 [Epithele typhae]
MVIVNLPSPSTSPRADSVLSSPPSPTLPGARLRASDASLAHTTALLDATLAELANTTHTARALHASLTHATRALATAKSSAAAHAHAAATHRAERELALEQLAWTERELAVAEEALGYAAREIVRGQRAVWARAARAVEDRRQGRGERDGPTERGCARCARDTWSFFRARASHLVRRGSTLSAASSTTACENPSGISASWSDASVVSVWAGEERGRELPRMAREDSAASRLSGKFKTLSKSFWRRSTRSVPAVLRTR